MFVDPTQEYFVPTINRNSQELAATLHPIHERQGFEERKRRDRMAQLTAAVDSQRKKDETFAPKTNPLPPGISLENRVPLAERSNALMASTMGKSTAAPEQPPTPVVNPTSESLVRSGAREAALEGHSIRRQVQQLWSSFAVDSAYITKPAARQCLLSVGATSESTVRKFLQALGFHNDEHADHGVDSTRGVDYDRFSKVLAAVLKAARTTTAAAAATAAVAVPQGQSRADATTVHMSKGKQATHSPAQLPPPPRASSSSRRYSTIVSVTAPPVASGPTTQKHMRRSADEETVTRAAECAASRATTPTSESARSASRARAQQASTNDRHGSGGAAIRGRSTTTANVTHRHPVVVDIPTFSPHINHNVVPVKERGAIHARPMRREETELAMERIKNERRIAEMQECTFHPVITAKATKTPPSTSTTRQRSLSASVDSVRPGYSTSEVPSDPRGGGRVAARVAHRLSTSPPRSSEEADEHRAELGEREHSSPSPRKRNDPDRHAHARHIAIGEDLPPTEIDSDENRDTPRNGPLLSRQNTTGPSSLSPSRRHSNGRRRTPLRSAFDSDRHTPQSSKSPSIASTSIATSVASGVLGVTRGFDKAVQRMVAARALSKQRFEESLRGGSHAYDPHVFPQDPRGKGDTAAVLPAPPTVSSPFHFRTDERSVEREQSKPFLYVDVDLPHGKVGRIGVHRGDNAAQLAKSFCASYGLEEGTCYRLTDILQEKIDAVLRERTRTLWV